jgi:hypothetical protein
MKQPRARVRAERKSAANPAAAAALPAGSPAEARGDEGSVPAATGGTVVALPTVVEKATSDPASARLDFEILIPIWGESYIKRFAELGLRSLLAPGNLPWLCNNHNVKVTVLTTHDGSEHLRAWESFNELARLAEVAFVGIEDLLITYGRNYTVILTRAYNRAMALGPHLVGRNFIYLVGDQIFADGSLQTIAKAMQAGADACLACTPRIDADVVEQKLVASGTPIELALTCRELADIVVSYPHPTAVAKTVQNDVVHLSVAHQFFWRPAPDTVVSRCFLLHMLCIRPTCRPRDIAAPCDFAFVTELAPEGRYHYLTDSDQFLAIELQNPLHETEFITTFDLGPADIAEAISAWATPMHYELANATFVFRGGDSTYPMAEAAALTQPYIDKLMHHLPPLRGHRHHPFWLGAVGAQLLRVSTRNRHESSEAPRRLSELIAAHIERLAPVDLGITVCDRPSQVDDIIARGSRSAVRITTTMLHRQIEDVAAPGGNILLVQDGQLSDFLQLFSDRDRLARLLRAIGRGRAVLLSYRIRLNDLRSANMSRLQLHRVFASRLSLFVRFGLTPHIYDLAAEPLDRMSGFVIEVLGDEAGRSLTTSPQRFKDLYDDPLYGERGMVSEPA